MLPPRIERSIGSPCVARSIPSWSIKASRSGVLLGILCICLSAQPQDQVGSEQTTQSPRMGGQRQNIPDCSSSSLDTTGCASIRSFGGLGQNPQTGKTDGQQPLSPEQDYTDTMQMTGPASKPSSFGESRVPAQRLTEFQRFVASTTGEVLPIFGSSLFRRVPSTFAPLEMTPVPPDYVLGPGDELRIRVWGQLRFQADVRVDRSGNVYLPQVGSVHVASIRFAELEAHLRNAIGRVFHNFDLNVDLGKIRSIQIYLAGRARVPGLYTVSSLTNIVDALFAGGGPALEGSLRGIQLRRGTETIAHFDLYDLLVSGFNAQDAKLQSGDVIFIPPVGAQVAISGSVKSPGIYEILPGETLYAAIANAGGVSSVASSARVSIERIEAHNQRHAMEVAYDPDGLKTPMIDGDIVRIFPIVPKYTRTIALRGNIASPGRFAWHPGMHISELIPDKESLVTRNYWWRRSQLGLPAPEFEESAAFRELKQPEEKDSITLEPPLAQSSVNSQQDLASSTEKFSGTSSLGAQQVPVNRAAQSPQRTEIRLIAPDINWDYAAVERIDPDTLKTTIIPFDLGKLVLQHDSSQDLELKSGDIITIFSETDVHVPRAEQTKLVTLEGEFAHSGVYTVQPNETLRELVERAGGLSPKAYLYGSEFTRQSVRVAQQVRMDEYIQALETRIQRANLSLAASSASTTQDLAAGAAAQNSQRDLVNSLRQVRATGRIVLTLKPDSLGTSDLPEMTLENGDRFVIPPVPDVITVIGAVYNQNSFLYVPGRTGGAYLLQAGGPNRDADRRHEFVIRANGDVLSKDAGNSVWHNGFEHLRLNPGDTVVVPEKTFKPSALRGVIDWSQVFSQFALGAAAINVIK